MKNDKGFGAIEALLVIVALAILGFVGYRAYDAYKLEEADKSQQLKNRDNKEKTVEEQTESGTTYLEIDSWGVKFPTIPSSKLKIQSYDADWPGNWKNNKPPKGYSAFTIHASALDKYEGCDEASTLNGKDRVGSLAIISRQNKSTTAQNLAAQPPTLIKSIGNYKYHLQMYYAYCFTQVDIPDDELNQAEDKTNALLKELRSSLKKMSK